MTPTMIYRFTPMTGGVATGRGGAVSGMENAAGMGDISIWQGMEGELGVQMPAEEGELDTRAELEPLHMQGLLAQGRPTQIPPLWRSLIGAIKQETTSLVPLSILSGWMPVIGLTTPEPMDYTLDWRLLIGALAVKLVFGRALSRAFSLRRIDGAFFFHIGRFQHYHIMQSLGYPDDLALFERSRWGRWRELKNEDIERLLGEALPVDGASLERVGRSWLLPDSVEVERTNKTANRFQMAVLYDGRGLSKDQREESLKKSFPEATMALSLVHLNFAGGSHTIRLYQPPEDVRQALGLPTEEMVIGALKRLPVQMAAQIDEVYLNPYYHPDHFGAYRNGKVGIKVGIYGDKKEREKMVWTDSELLKTFLHETGHALHVKGQMFSTLIKVMIAGRHVQARNIRYGDLDYEIDSYFGEVFAELIERMAEQESQKTLNPYELALIEEVLRSAPGSWRSLVEQQHAAKPGYFHAGRFHNYYIMKSIAYPSDHLVFERKENGWRELSSEEITKLIEEDLTVNGTNLDRLEKIWYSPIDVEIENTGHVERNYQKLLDHGKLNASDHQYQTYMEKSFPDTDLYLSYIHLRYPGGTHTVRFYQPNENIRQELGLPTEEMVIHALKNLPVQMISQIKDIYLTPYYHPKWFAFYLNSTVAVYGNKDTKKPAWTPQELSKWFIHETAHALHSRVFGLAALVRAMIAAYKIRLRDFDYDSLIYEVHNFSNEMFSGLFELMIEKEKRDTLNSYEIALIEYALHNAPGNWRELIEP